MAVDRGYGSGYKNTGKAKATPARTESAKLRRKNIKRVASRPFQRSIIRTFDAGGGKYLEAGANPYGMIASAILRGAARLLKPSSGTALEGAAKITAANQSRFNAAIFNAAARTPAARGAANRVITNAVTRAAQTGSDEMFARNAAQNAMRLGGEITDAFRLQRSVVRPQEYDAIQRAMAKILGRAGRVDPVYRQIGRDLRISARRTFTSDLGKKAK